MFATDVLLKEHDVILKMLDATDAVGQRLMRGGNVSPDTLDGLRIAYKTVVRYVGKC
jgi:hemerythrin-like domain-containing protein